MGANRGDFTESPMDAECKSERQSADPRLLGSAFPENCTLLESLVRDPAG